MSCPYYWYNNHYACQKSGKDVNEDTYYKYCRNYDYDDCPIYKGNDTSGCFLTSACIEAKSLDDNCYELTTLRRFRDEYMASLECGKYDVNHYYYVAPTIVSKIKEQSNSIVIFEQIYNELVIPCVKYIDALNYEAAYTLYKNYVLSLESQYC